MRTLLRSLALVGALTTSLALAQDVERLSQEDRDEIAFMLRRGELQEAADILDEVLEEDPGDLRSRTLRARARFELCDYEGALADVELAYAEGGRGTDDEVDRAGFAEAARVRALLLTELGRASEAVEILERAGGALVPSQDPRDGWVSGVAHLEAGRREEAMEHFRAGAGAEAAGDWRGLLDQARCQRALGRLRQAAATLVAADRAAVEDQGTEPDVLAELGSLYFEAYGEVDDPVSLAHSPAEQFREALGLHPQHEAAQLGLFELYRFNWMRNRKTPDEILDEIFSARADSIRGLVARTSSALDDGDLPLARRSLARLEELAPGRRDVRAEKAALAWIEHRQDEARGILAELVEEDPQDAGPERVVGRHLIALYRFAEARPFLSDSVERDPGDWRSWTELGHALANVGDEDEALAALEKAVELSAGRKDAWRDNTLKVLRKLHEHYQVHESGELSFAWLPDAAFILQTYLEPFYRDAREELAERYGFTPDPVHIEVFRDWSDFSVRSTGYEGFPALGVCFGPVVTAVSPVSQMRGNFSWARTSYHEFTHVIHLGLSHNRCPRWVTEGLATWEEGRRSSAWWRNMRRDLLDARANGRIIPLRRLNNAFRGGRVLFAYYQSGLLCQMLVRDHGFQPMVRLLEAFDRGLDLDQAFESVFDRTPEEIDASFAEYVDDFLEGLEIEPQWNRHHTFQLRFSLSRRPPQDVQEQRAWADEWCTVAWGFHYQGQRVDAEEALRLAETVGELPPRGFFLRAEMLLARGDRDAAREAFRTGFEQGGSGYRARMALGQILMQDGKLDLAQEHFLAAEANFPGFPEEVFSAELKLAELYERRDQPSKAMEARMRWLRYNGGDFENRMLVAGWLDDQGRHEESVVLWAEANEVDPFRRFLHYRWGLALRHLGRHEEALREFHVALQVPANLDPDSQDGIQALDPEELELLLGRDGDREGAPENEPEAGRPETVDWASLAGALHGWKALSLFDLGRLDEARKSAQEALEIDPECEPGLRALERLER